MKTENFTFLSTNGKTNIHAVKWLPEDGKYTAILQITHGMIEFIERYIPFAEFLTENGIMVVGHDHLGHGQSVESQEDWGYIGMPHPSDLLVEDMHKLRTLIQKENQGVPYFMLAHSMGSYMLRKYITVHNDNLDGVIVMGTGSVPDSTTNLGFFVTKCLSMVRGWHYRSSFVADASFGKPYQQYDLTGKTLNNSWLTKNEDIVKRYYADPRCTFVFTINGYRALFEAVQYDGKEENARKIRKDLPMFIVSGEDDPVGDMGEGVKKVYAMYQRAGIQDVKCKLYKGDRHEILNELDCDVVFADILNWIKEHIK